MRALSDFGLRVGLPQLSALSSLEVVSVGAIIGSSGSTVGGGWCGLSCSGDDSDTDQHRSSCRQQQQQREGITAVGLAAALRAREEAMRGRENAASTAPAVAACGAHEGPNDCISSSSMGRAVGSKEKCKAAAAAIRTRGEGDTATGAGGGVTTTAAGAASADGERGNRTRGLAAAGAAAAEAAEVPEGSVAACVSASVKAAAGGNGPIVMTGAGGGLACVAEGTDVIVLLPSHDGGRPRLLHGSQLPSLHLRWTCDELTYEGNGGEGWRRIVERLVQQQQQQQEE